MVIGTAAGLSNAVTIALSVLLAFVFGYSLTMLPLLRDGLPFRSALPLALASDTLSIAVMEIVSPPEALIVSPPRSAGARPSGSAPVRVRVRARSGTG